MNSTNVHRLFSIFSFFPISYYLVLYRVKIWVLFILRVLQYHQNDWHPEVSYGPLNPRNYREVEISEKVQKPLTLVFTPVPLGFSFF